MLKSVLASQEGVAIRAWAERGKEGRKEKYVGRPDGRTEGTKDCRQDKRGMIGANEKLKRRGKRAGWRMMAPQPHFIAWETDGRP